MPVTLASAGSTNPYANAGQYDWAVARLDRVVPGVKPYSVGLAPSVGQTILMVSASTSGTRRYGLCRIREVIGGAGQPRELRTDCTGTDGMSGAAYLTAGRNPQLLGIHVGYRSSDPGAAKSYSATHYTFGTSSEGAFRRAIAF